MAITIDDFDKVWASESPLTPYEFSESQYKEGWNFVGGTPPSRQMWDAFMKNADEKLKYLYNHEDVPVGFEYFTMNPNIPQGSLPLLGGEYSRETYSALWSWVQEQTGYLKTEAEWQTLSTANNGNVPFYSDGDGSTTFRVPSLHCWIKGSDGSAQLVGSYLQAGLPNISGGFTADRFGYGGASGLQYGALSFGSSDNYGGWSGSNFDSNVESSKISFDASQSNSIYGNANTVQPESIVGMWLVKAYGTIADSGQIDEQAYIDDRFNASKQYTDTQVGAVKSIQLAGLKFYTWRGNLTSDSGGNVQIEQYPILNTIPMPSQGLRLFTANIINASAVEHYNTQPWVYENLRWIISVINKVTGVIVPNYTAEFVLTWAVEE